jgi:hypothetical protein
MLLVAALASSAVAQQEMSGNRWNRLNEDMKMGFAVGFLQGVEFGDQIIIVGFGSVGADTSTLVKAEKLYSAYRGEQHIASGA